MNLEAGPDAPLIAHVAATALLVTHIAGGAVGLASGAVAMTARKGGRLHRRAGTAFFAGMLAMAAVGAGVSPFLPEAKWTNTTAGVFTFYLVVTGWAAGRRRGAPGLLERLAAVVSTGIVLMGLGLAATGRGEAFATVYAFAVIAAVAAAGDWRLLRQGGLERADRVARHLWRMSAALAIAAGAFFLGQPRFVPEPIRGTLLAALPMLTSLALMVYWLVRTKRGGRRRAAALRPQAAEAA